MARREHELAIYRGSQRQDKFHADVDPGNLATVEREGHRWLERERVPRELWHDYAITVPGALGAREVRL